MVIFRGICRVFLTGLIVFTAPSAVVLIASGSVATGLGMLWGVNWEFFMKGIADNYFFPAGDTIL
jgi:hypothetical protein